MSDEATPLVPHLGGEFGAWLWYTCENVGGELDLGEPIGKVRVWIDQRLAFRNPAETRVTAVMTGVSPSTAPETRAAFAGGKILHDLRIGYQRDEREVTVTLKGPAIEVAQAKLPGGGEGGPDGALFDRMLVYEELDLVLAGLFQRFAAVRTSAAWDDEIVPAMATWAKGAAV